MDSLAILIPVALLLCAVTIAAFVWAVKSDQFEDLERHGEDVLFEDEPDTGTKNKLSSRDGNVD